MTISFVCDVIFFDFFHFVYTIGGFRYVMFLVLCLLYAYVNDVIVDTQLSTYICCYKGRYSHKQQGWWRSCQKLGEEGYGGNDHT